MLRSYKFPKELVDIAEQHHGTSLLKFFYYKAKEKGDQITEKEFRYPVKPQSKEAAIISVTALKPPSVPCIIPIPSGSKTGAGNYIR